MGLAVTARDLLNPAAIYRRTIAQTGISSGSATSIPFNVEDHNIGGWMTVPGSSLVAPSGSDGIYILTFEVLWEAFSPHIGYREIWVGVEGTSYAKQRCYPTIDGESHAHETTTVVLLVAGDAIIARVRHTQTVNSAVLSARIAVKRLM